MSLFIYFILGCKRKEDVVATNQDMLPSPKKPRLVFTDLQRRTLQAIFKVYTNQYNNIFNLVKFTLLYDIITVTKQLD